MFSSHVFYRRQSHLTLTGHPRLNEFAVLNGLGNPYLEVRICCPIYWQLYHITHCLKSTNKPMF